MSDVRIPQKGIHVQSAMKWLFDRLITNATPIPVPFTYSDDPHHFGGGTENMKLLYSVCGYVNSAESGIPLSDHNAMSNRERLINFYRSENGHGGGEPLTVSHCQLHIGGHAAAALHAYQINDQPVLDLALGWLQIEYYLLSLCEVDGEPWTPGARGVLKGKVVGENPTRGKFLRAVREGKSPKPNQYDLGACCVAKLPSALREYIAEPPVKPIKIQGDLSIYRSRDNSFAAVFNSLPTKGGGVQAAGYDGVEKWIERDANTPEVAVKVGKLSRLKATTGVSAVFDSPAKRERVKEKAVAESSAVPPVKVPATCAELMEAANLPYRQGNALISRADPALVNQCFSAIYPNFGHGYMHAPDHYAALLIINEREPTFREVQDSYHITGSKNIDLARQKSGAGLRPEGWDNWTDFQKRVAILTHLYGASRGGRIADGKVKDPDPKRTQALMVLWGLKVEPVEPDKPVEPPVTPPVTPPPPVIPAPPVVPPTLPSTDLSDPIQRAKELLSLVPAEYHKPWYVAALAEVVRSVRRIEDRIVERVVERLKAK